MKNKKVCIIGLGYIGLPTAALLANRGYNVHGVDIVQDTVDTINKGDIHIIEPELDIYVKAAVNSGKLKADITPCEADIFIIAVPTPLNSDKSADISFVLEASQSIIPYIKDETIIILESTSPVGTTQKIEKLFTQHNIDMSKLFLAYCPERVLPGKIIQELVQNDRIVGGISKDSTNKVIEFYKTFVEGEIFGTECKIAELAKLSENAFRDTNIAFANEISMICDKLNINVKELISLTNRHPRVNILNPGVGVGGHCIAVDPWFIIETAKKESTLIKTSREVNLFKTQWVIEKIENSALKFELEYQKKPTVSCLGLAFKPNIDDLRESPAVHIVSTLIEKEYNVLTVEPNILKYKDIQLTSLDQAMKADIIVILVAHKEFKEIKSNNILDFCGALND